MKERAYAVPFLEVWRAALAAAGSVDGWTVQDREPGRGRLRVESRTNLPRTAAEVEVRLSLDQDGLTRVVVTSTLRSGSFDFGANRSRTTDFLQRLDRALGGAGRR